MNKHSFLHLPRKSQTILSFGVGQAHSVPLCLSVCCSATRLSNPPSSPFDTIGTFLAGVLSILAYPPLSVLKWPAMEWYNTFRFLWFGIWGTTFLKKSHFSFIFRQLRTIFHFSYKISMSQHFDAEGSVWAKVIDLRDSGFICIPSLRSWSPLYHILPVWHF